MPVALVSVVAVPPRGDAANDEEALAGLDEPEQPRLAHERRLGARGRDPLLEVLLLDAQRVHLRAAAVELRLRAGVRVEGLPVEERDERERADGEQACGPQAGHVPPFAVRAPRPTRC